VREIVQGEVYWYDFGPAIGSGPADLRPCVVIQGSLFNQSRIATTIVCAITSKDGASRGAGKCGFAKGAGRAAASERGERFSGFHGGQGRAGGTVGAIIRRGAGGGVGGVAAGDGELGAGEEFADDGGWADVEVDGEDAVAGWQSNYHSRIYPRYG
jgi:hypothetical protein